MELGLVGKRAAVAAGSSGLGLGSARALAAEGAKVAICGRSASRLEEAAGSIGGDVTTIEADVSTAAGATDFVERATAELGGLDILVPNAGGPPPGNFASTPLDAYPDAIDLNLMSVVAMCKAAVPAMRAQGWGRVVAITSISVRMPTVDLILSTTARTGATGFLKALALEVASDGVTINSVQPGLHLTPRIAEIYGDDLPDTPMGDPDDFGAAVAFLCSQQARYITGAALHIDGGAYTALQ